MQTQLVKAKMNKKTICLLILNLLADTPCIVSFGSSPSWHSIQYTRSTTSLPSSQRTQIRKRTTAATSLSMFDGSARTSNSAILDNVHVDRTGIRNIHGDKTNIGSLVVPSIGIGTISWSSKSLTTLENLELQSLVNEACNSDAAFFDTAERYGSHLKTALGLGWGETESLLKTFVDRASASSRANSMQGNGESSNAIYATKFCPSPWRTTVESVVEACEQSRLRLGVDQIDLYQLHMPDIVKPFRFLGMNDSLDEVYWEGLAECHRRGLVKNVGVSNYGPTLVSKCQDALGKRGVPLASNQIGYSLIGRQNGSQETVDMCAELGIKVLGYYPFAMGLLTGKYSSNTMTPMTDPTLTINSSKKTALELNDLNMYADGDGVKVPKGGISPLLSRMEAIAEVRGKTIAQVALNYIVCKGVIPIPGAGSAAQAKDNIGAMGWRLTDTEVRLLEDEADELGFSFEGAGFKRTNEKFVGYGVEKWSLD